MNKPCRNTLHIPLVDSILLCHAFHSDVWTPLYFDFFALKVGTGKCLCALSEGAAAPPASENVQRMSQEQPTRPPGDSKKPATRPRWRGHGGPARLMRGPIAGSQCARKN